MEGGQDVLGFLVVWNDFLSGGHRHVEDLGDVVGIAREEGHEDPSRGILDRPFDQRCEFVVGGGIARLIGVFGFRQKDEGLFLGQFGHRFHIVEEAGLGVVLDHEVTGEDDVPEARGNGQTAAIGAFREAFEKAKPVILEPIMKVEVEGPSEFQGNIFGSINQRRGMIVSSTEDNNQCQVIAEVPLSEMFGYSTVLRSLTQGKAEFTMEVAKYGRVPQSVSDELKKAYQEKKKAGAK